MEFGDVFIGYCSVLGIGKYDNKSFYLTVSEFIFLNDLEKIEEIQHGGLVLGKSHFEGGVNLLTFHSQENLYRYNGEMEGWEFISGPLISKSMNKYFENINGRMKGYLRNQNTSFHIPKNCHIYDVREKLCPILLTTPYSHYIINRWATRSYINELILADKYFLGY